MANTMGHVSHTYTCTHANTCTHTHRAGWTQDKPCISWRDFRSLITWKNREPEAEDRLNPDRQPPPLQTTTVATHPFFLPTFLSWLSTTSHSMTLSHKWSVLIKLPGRLMLQVNVCEWHWVILVSQWSIQIFMSFNSLYFMCDDII